MQVKTIKLVLIVENVDLRFKAGEYWIRFGLVLTSELSLAALYDNITEQRSSV